MSDNESSDSRSQAGADPGGYRFPFGVHQGKRIEDVPQGLRYWAVHPNRNKNRWYADLAEANNRYEEHLCNICQPHEWILPFSKYMGKTIAEVPEDYRWRMANPQHSNDTWYPWFVQANNRYQASLNPDRSPGSEIIWFGKRYKGYRFDAAYNRKGFVNFCLAPDKINMSWYARFKDLCERYEAWLSNHRREYRPRRAAVIQNPVGEPIGPWDDRAGSADPDEEYERDNFVVSDGEEIVTESEHGSFLDNDDDMDVDDDDNDYKPSQEEIGNTSGPGIDDERGNIRQASPDPDDDVSVVELAKSQRRNSRTIKSPKRLYRRRDSGVHGDVGSSETDAEASDDGKPLTRARKRAKSQKASTHGSPSPTKRLKHKHRIVDSDEDDR